MKHKVGDLVRIKSKEWYEENKNEFGSVNVRGIFVTEMSDLCGKIMKIESIEEASQFYKIKNLTGDINRCHWSDEMFEDIWLDKEQLILNIGDRVKVDGSYEGVIVAYYVCTTDSLGYSIRFENGYKNQSLHNACLYSYLNDGSPFKSDKDDCWLFDIRNHTFEKIDKTEERLNLKVMKYKVGDLVRVKSLDWYNQNKDKNGIVGTKILFVESMSSYCGQTLKISSANESEYVLTDLLGNVNKYSWTDDMFEDSLIDKDRLPLDIGDRVITDKGEGTIVAYYFSKGFNNYEDGHGYTVSLVNDNGYHRGTRFSYDKNGAPYVHSKSNCVYFLNERIKLIKKEDKMRNKFTLSDLKPGYIVETRDNTLYMVCEINNCYYLVGNNGWIETIHYKPDLTHLYYEGLDIIKVYTITTVSTFTIMLDYGNLKLLWERPQIKEMTIQEIEEELCLKSGTLRIKK